MVKCSQCENTGYEHYIDLQGQSYDWLYDNQEPIYMSLMNEEHSLCAPCADKIKIKHSAEYVIGCLQGEHSI